MKQCPNPNCILYTRLEELPDAYVKCPGCGGLLVGIDSQSGQLNSGRLSNRRLSSGPASAPRGGTSPQSSQGKSSPSATPPLIPDADPYDPYGVSGPYDPYAPLRPVQSQPSAQSGPASGPYAVVPSDTGHHGAAQAAMSPHVSQSAYVSTSQLNTAKWTTASKVAFGVGSVLLLLACGLLGWIFSNRFFPQSRVIASPQATETALALVRPPVNTPIAQPSLTTLAGNFPGPTRVGPTSPIEAPTTLVVVPTPAAATEVPPVSAPTTQPAEPGPAAPPAQQEPTGGILTAHMTSGEGGAVAEYSPNEPFNLAAQATFGQGNVTSVLTRWYGPEGSQIYAMQKDYTQPGTYYVAFTVRKNTPWLPGTYRVDIYTNNAPTPSYSVFFSVAGGT
ncbi:MAG: hypothetical protein M3441_08850 [Chloroflexota bacterium]|nr:hypothetical protein [Chloroflexota bacterium]